MWRVLEHIANELRRFLVAFPFHLAGDAAGKKIFKIGHEGLAEAGVPFPARAPD